MSEINISEALNKEIAVRGLSDKQVELVLAMACQGATAREIYTSLGLTSIGWYRLLQANPLLQRAYSQCAHYGIDERVDSLLTVHEEHADPQMARLISLNTQWIAARRYRERYGDSLSMDVTQVPDLRSHYQARDVQVAELIARRRAGATQSPLLASGFDDDSSGSKPEDQEEQAIDEIDVFEGI